jgi:hypothetical protein
MIAAIYARATVLAAIALALTGCLGGATYRNATGREPSEAEAEDCYQKAERSTTFADTLRACLREKGYQPVKE